MVTLQPFDSEADAIEHANNTDYGLSATVWTEDIEKEKGLPKELMRVLSGSIAGYCEISGHLLVV